MFVSGRSSETGDSTAYAKWSLQVFEDTEREFIISYRNHKWHKHVSRGSTYHIVTFQALYSPVVFNTLSQATLHLGQAAGLNANITRRTIQMIIK